MSAEKPIPSVSTHGALTDDQLADYLSQRYILRSVQLYIEIQELARSAPPLATTNPSPQSTPVKDM
jgi:hypothetical protein